MYFDNFHSIIFLMSLSAAKLFILRNSPSAFLFSVCCLHEHVWERLLMGAHATFQWVYHWWKWHLHPGAINIPREGWSLMCPAPSLMKHWSSIMKVLCRSPWLQWVHECMATSCPGDIFLQPITLFSIPTFLSPSPCSQNFRGTDIAVSHRAELSTLIIVTI